MSERIIFISQRPYNDASESPKFSYGAIPSSYQFLLEGKPVTHLAAGKGCLFAINRQADICIATYQKGKSPLLGTIQSSKGKITLVLTDRESLEWIRLIPHLEEKSVGPAAYALPWNA